MFDDNKKKKPHKDLSMQLWGMLHFLVHIFISMYNISLHYTAQISNMADHIHPIFTWATVKASQSPADGDHWAPSSHGNPNRWTHEV